MREDLRTDIGFNWQNWVFAANYALQHQHPNDALEFAHAAQDEARGAEWVRRGEVVHSAVVSALRSVAKQKRREVAAHESLDWWGRRGSNPATSGVTAPLLRRPPQPFAEGFELVAGDDGVEDAEGHRLPVGGKLVELAHAFQEARVLEQGWVGWVVSGEKLVEGHLQDSRETDRGVEGWQGLPLFITGDLHVIDAALIGNLGDRQSLPLSILGQPHSKLACIHRFLRQSMRSTVKQTC